MNKEEIKEYLKRVDKLEIKLQGQDKDTLQWLIFGYNQDILNTYTDEELEEMILWINSSDELSNIIISETDIDLITDDAERKINDAITKESNND